MQNEHATSRSAAAKANPRAASVRVKALPLSRAKSQRTHDLRIGDQPNYVDEDRKHLNRVLMPLRSLPSIHRENEALRGERGCQKKMKSNAAAVMSGIITFGHHAQVMFACLSDEQQDAAYVEVAERAAALLQTQLEGLIVHADETADHAHFMLRGYCDDGEPVSKRATYQAMSQLQDIVAEVMQAYCPDIERGNGKWDRIANGADYAETLSRSVTRLHQDLPHEIAEVEATLQILVEEMVGLQASIAKTRRHFETMEARRDKTAKQLKTARTYKKRLAKKETALAELVMQCGQLRVELDAKDKALNSRETEADCRDEAHQAEVMAHADMMALEAEQFAAEHDALDAQWADHATEVRAQKAAAEAHAFALQTERERMAEEKAAHHADVVAHADMVAVESEQFAAEYDALADEWADHMAEVRSHQAVAKAREVDLRLEQERATENKRAFDEKMAAQTQAFARQQADIAVDEYLSELMRFYAEDMQTAATEQAKAANLAREIDEAAAETARLQATHAKREESDAHAKATHFTELANEAKARLKAANAASVAAQSEAMAATKQLETAISAEANAKVEAAKALAVRDQRFAEITDAANAQKLIDDARLRDLDAISKANGSVKQVITLEQGALAQDRAAHVEDIRRKQAGADARKAALLAENERLAQVVELGHQAGLARRADEYAAEAAGLKAADAKREAVAAKEKAAHFKDLVRDAEASLDILIFGKNEVMEATEGAIAQRDAARVDETVAKAEAAEALETRDARLAEIADAAAAQKQIDDTRERDLAVASRANETAAQKVTARETAINASEKGIVSLCGALSAGEITIGNDGRLRMTDSQYVKAMPSKLRAVLVPIIKTIIDLKLRLSERLAVVETRIRKIEDFLKRDDLTVDARVEAENLQTPNWSDSADDPS